MNTSGETVEEMSHSDNPNMIRIRMFLPFAMLSIRIGPTINYDLEKTSINHIAIFLYS